MNFRGEGNPAPQYIQTARDSLPADEGARLTEQRRCLSVREAVELAHATPAMVAG